MPELLMILVVALAARWWLMAEPEPEPNINPQIDEWNAQQEEAISSAR